MPTPVEVWAPAFEKVLPGKIEPGRIFSSAGEREGSRWCVLCETYVRFGEQKRHARAHGREREAWRRRGRRSAEQQREGERRQVERLRREEEKVLGRAPSGAGGRPRAARRSSAVGGQEKGVSMASTNEKEGRGHELFVALLKRVSSIGTPIVHKDGQYARVMIDDAKRNVGYIVPGKTKLNVYPQAEAKDMPKDLPGGFKQVKLGTHHYGRGEVIVPVESEDDFDGAVAALTAASKLPPRQRKAAAKAKPKAEPAKAANGNGQPKKAAKKSPAKAKAAAK